MAERLLLDYMESHRDQWWNRDPELRIDDQRFVQSFAFCALLADSRRPRPSLFIAVCGGRDAHRCLPYNGSVSEAGFRDELKVTMSKEKGVRGLARVFLTGAGMTLRGEPARVTGLSNPEARLGNWALVDQDLATRVAPSVYKLKNLQVATLNSAKRICEPRSLRILSVRFR